MYKVEQWKCTRDCGISNCSLFIVVVLTPVCAPCFKKLQINQPIGLIGLMAIENVSKSSQKCQETHPQHLEYWLNMGIVQKLMDSMRLCQVVSVTLCLGN